MEQGFAYNNTAGKLWEYSHLLKTALFRCLHLFRTHWSKEPVTFSKGSWMEMAYCFILKVWVVTIFPFSLVASGQSSTKVQIRQMLTRSQKNCKWYQDSTMQLHLPSHNRQHNYSQPLSLWLFQSWLCATLAVLEEPLRLLIHTSGLLT